jgi:hypothetical protein
MKSQVQSFLAAGAAVLVAVSNPGVSQAGTACDWKSREVRAEVASLEANLGARVVAVGRVDSVSSSDGVSVLGLGVRPSVGDRFQVGDYAAVVDWSDKSDQQILEVRSLDTRYVPGVSEVFVRSLLKAHDASHAKLRIGEVDVDYSLQVLTIADRQLSSKTTLAVRGIQPSPGGVILSRCVSVIDGSMGTGRAEGSMGTGRTDGSMGTGRTDGSMGTVRTDGSMGTGRAEGSMGTGRAEGSMGTGRAEGSMGTGRTDGSMGTGRAEGSMGTGRTDGSMGTGRAEGSMGTGRTDGSMGTGKLNGSMGTGRAEGSMGTG